MPQSDPYFSLGAIARRLREPVHRIAHVIRTRKIAPAMRLANLRFFDPAAVDRIRRELAEIDSHRACPAGR